MPKKKSTSRSTHSRVSSFHLITLLGLLGVLGFLLYQIPQVQQYMSGAAAPRVGTTQRVLVLPSSGNADRLRSKLSSYRAQVIGEGSDRVFVLSLTPPQLTQLRRDPLVSRVILDSTYKSNRAAVSPSAAVPDHSGSPTLDVWAERNRSPLAAAIGAFPYHDKLKFGKGIDIFVIGAGVNAEDPDLTGRLAGWKNYAAKDNARYTCEGDSKSYAVSASTPIDESGADTKNIRLMLATYGSYAGTGVVGVAPQARVYALKVSDCTGVSSYLDEVLALDFAYKKKAKIVVHNTAWPVNPPTEEVGDFVYYTGVAGKIIARMRAQGTVVVAMAGQEGVEAKTVDGSTQSYPGKLADTLTVNLVQLPTFTPHRWSATGSTIDFAAGIYPANVTVPGVDLKNYDISMVDMGTPSFLTAGAIALAYNDIVSATPKGMNRVDAIEAFLKENTVPSTRKNPPSSFTGYGVIKLNPPK